SPVGYSTKSNVTSSAIAGGTATNLLGSFNNATVTGTAVDNHLTTPVPITAATLLVSAANSDTLAATPANGSSFTVDGKSITFSTAQTTVTTDGHGKRSGVRQCLGRGARRRPELAGHPRQPGRAVQQRATADQHHVAGLVLQRHQSLERRYPEADVQ